MKQSFLPFFDTGLYYACISLELNNYEPPDRTETFFAGYVGPGSTAIF